MQSQEQSKVKIIFDPGSTHMRNKEYAKELVDHSAKAGADAIKFQLFPMEKAYLEAGNVALPFDWFTELFHYGLEKGIEVTASTFNYESLNLIAKHAVPFIKFAYSQQTNHAGIVEMLAVGKTVMVTSDTMNVYKVLGYPRNDQERKRLKLLWTYTVNDVVQYGYSTDLHFGKVFDTFDGFSDHSLDERQAVKAVKAGAKWVEKHISLDKREVNCPDDRFAIKGKQLKAFVEAVKGAA